MPRIIIFIVAALILLGSSFLGVRFFLSQQKGDLAGLKVTSIPTSSVFLNEKNIGRTPYEDKLAEGEYTLKLIPEITAQDVVTWQGRIKLSANLLTYVNRELSSSELTSAGEILSLEKINSRRSSVAVFTTPDGAEVHFNGSYRGTAPLTLDDIEPGNYELSISSPGFISRSIKIRATSGYKLNAEVQLTLGKETADEVKITPKPGEEGTVDGLAKPYVKILDTPTGWLRVRDEPTTTATEAAKVNPGDTFALLDEESGWYKIEYEEGKTGWISGRYAEKVE